MKTYRKIYEQHYGPIPTDEDGRTYEIHHIDGNHNNDILENLKAVSIQEHYYIHYAQGDWNACLRIAERMKLDPKLFSELATKNNLQRVAKGIHQFLGGEIQRTRVANGTHNFLGPDTNNQKVKDGTHPFLGGELQRKTQLKRVKDGTHHLLKRADGTSQASDRVANGSHHFLGGEIARKTAQTQISNGTHNFQTRSDGTNLQTDKVSAGTHHFLGVQEKVKCPHCPKTGGLYAMKRWHFDNCKKK